MISRFFKQTVYVGLAIQPDRLSMMKLKQIKTHITIEEFATITLPKGWVVDGNIHQPDELGYVIKQLIHETKARASFAALALPYSQVINKRIRVPAFLNEQELAVEIASHLKFYLPAMNEPLHFDFMPVAKHHDELELQLIAARKEQVETYRHLSHAGGIKINVVDVDVYALARGVQWIFPHYLKKTYVILDMDNTTAQLILLKAGNVISVYPLVMDAENIFFQQIKTGLQIFSAIDAILIEDIVVTGYLSRIDKLNMFLEQELAIRVTKIPYSKHALGKINANISEWLLVFGLALRGFAG